MTGSKLYFLALMTAILVVSCTGTKAVPEGDLLYTGAKVKLEGKDISKKTRKALLKELKELPRPKPNGSILGMRPKLFFYNLAGNVTKEKFLGYISIFK